VTSLDYFVAALELTDSAEARGSLFSQVLKNPHLAMSGIAVPETISAIRHHPSR